MFSLFTPRHACQCQWEKNLAQGEEKDVIILETLNGCAAELKCVYVCFPLCYLDFKCYKVQMSIDCYRVGGGQKEKVNNLEIMNKEAAFIHSAQKVFAPSRWVQFVWLSHLNFTSQYILKHGWKPEIKMMHRKHPLYLPNFHYLVLASLNCGTNVFSGFVFTHQLLRRESRILLIPPHSCQTQYEHYDCYLPIEQWWRTFLGCGVKNV